MKSGQCALRSLLPTDDALLLDKRTAPKSSGFAAGATYVDEANKELAAKIKAPVAL